MDLGLLQSEVAARIGACEASVWNWETGGREPELKWMPAILAFLGGDPRPEPQIIGARLVRFREARGWSQDRLAQNLRVDPTTLSRWELGKRKPSGAHLERTKELLSGG
jgi:transcriptional regulator with XRE-family HTH domain